MLVPSSRGEARAARFVGAHANRFRDGDGAVASIAVMESELVNEPVPGECRNDGTPAGSPGWKDAAEMALLVVAVIAVIVVAVIGFSYVGTWERCGWAGAEFALESRLDGGRICRLEIEGKWVPEVVVRRKMTQAEAQVDQRRGALVAAMEEDRAHRRAEGADGPESAKAARDRASELQALDDLRALRRSGDDVGAPARKKLLLAFIEEERRRRGGAIK